VWDVNNAPVLELIQQSNDALVLLLVRQTLLLVIGELLSRRGYYDT
jgi:hypothetical protein